MSTQKITGLIKAGRPKGSPNKRTARQRLETRDFFNGILDDETEAKFWRYFTTGYEQLETSDGRVQIIPLPLNPVAFAAFKRAVEYKRGMPVQITEITGKNGDGIQVNVTYIGRNRHQPTTEAS